MSRYNYSFSDNPPYAQVEANFIPNLQDFYDHPDRYAIDAFRIYGNLYYVGDRKVTSHLIDTGDGLILFDTGYGFGSLLELVRRITNKPLYVLNSHGHVDHACGNAQFGGAYIHPADMQLGREHNTAPYRMLELDTAEVPMDFDLDITRQS